MDIENVPKQVWIDAITGKINCEYESLAVKILLGRIKIDVKYNPSKEAYEKYAEELKNLFIKSQKLPSSQKDLKKILSNGGI